MPALLIVVALVIRLCLVWQPIDTLITVLTDDAFLYAEIARNVAHGVGPAFDISGPTNGFHPLWLVLITPIWFVADGDTAVHLALTLAALFGGVSVGLVYVIGYRLGGRSVATVAAGVWAVLPATVLITADGLETSVALFCAMLVLTLAGRYEDNRKAACAVPVGLAGGAMLLARTDTVFLFTLVGVWVVALAPQGRKVTHGACIALPAGALLLPWLGWNLVTFGTIVQVSGVAVPDALRGTSDDQRGIVALVVAVVSTLIVYGALLVMFPLALRVGKTRGVLWRRTILPLVIPAAALAALMVAHGYVRGVPRPYYFALASVVLALTIGRVFVHAATAFRRPVLFVILVAALLFDQTAVVWHRWGGDYPWQAEMLGAARTMGTLPEDARVGAWNSGILAYYGERPVVNLDGVVSQAAYAAMLDGGLGAYARSQGVTHIIDHARFPDHIYTRRLNGATLQPVRKLGEGNEHYGAYTLYEVRNQ